MRDQAWTAQGRGTVERPQRGAQGREGATRGGGDSPDPSPRSAARRRAHMRREVREQTAPATEARVTRGAAFPLRTVARNCDTIGTMVADE